MARVEKRFLFLLRQPPRRGARVRETLDVVQMAAAFDQPVALLFLDEGVWQLRAGAAPEETAQAVLPILRSLRMLAVDTLYVESESLAERGLTAADLILPTRPVDRAAVGDLLAQHEVILHD